jgi:uncharacterized protein (DUF1330 family)
MPVYAITAIDVIDQEMIGEYIKGAPPTILAAGGAILAVDDNPTVLEGDVPAGRIILLRFEDQAALNNWYHGEGYKQVRPIRWNSATTKFAITLEGFA